MTFARCRAALTALIVSFVPAAGTGHASGPPPIAGYVSAIDGRTTACVIQRGRKELPARYWTDLLTGDQVIARGDCRVELMPRDGPRRWTVVASNSPAAVTVRAQRQIPMPKMVETIGRVLSQWSDALQPPLPPKPAPRKKGAPPPKMEAAAVTPPAPKPLSVALLAGPVPQHLFAAARRFNLAWTGGQAPFTVVVSPRNPKQPTAPALPGEVANPPPWTFQVGAERVISSVIDPSPGLYDVRVTDAAGSFVTGSFEAVDSPPIIDLHDFESLPPGIARVLAAARLANMEGGAWRLEAHTRLTDLGRDDYAAALMAGRLLAGRDVPDPVADPPATPVAGAAGR